MKAKVLTLGLICFFIFASCTSPADPEIKKALNPGNPTNSGTIETSGDDPPVILYFYEEHLYGSTHCLYWDIAETPVATVTASWTLGEVPLTSTGSCMAVYETTTYTLTAISAGGSAEASVVIEPKERAVLEVTTIPEVPIFHYDSTPYYEKSESAFTLTITETNGVGGHLNYIEIIFPPDGRCSFSVIYHVDFEAFGSASYLFDVCANGRPTSMFFRSYCLDDNGYEFNIKVEIPFTWDN